MPVEMRRSRVASVGVIGSLFDQTCGPSVSLPKHAPSGRGGGRRLSACLPWIAALASCVLDVLLCPRCHRLHHKVCLVMAQFATFQNTKKRQAHASQSCKCRHCNALQASLSAAAKLRLSWLSETAGGGCETVRITVDRL